MHGYVDGWDWLWMTVMMAVWIVLLSCCSVRSSTPPFGSLSETLATAGGRCEHSRRRA